MKQWKYHYKTIIMKVIKSIFNERIWDTKSKFSLSKKLLLYLFKGIHVFVNISMCIYMKDFSFLLKVYYDFKYDYLTFWEQIKITCKFFKSAYL